MFIVYKQTKSLIRSQYDGASRNHPQAPASLKRKLPGLLYMLLKVPPCSFRKDYPLPVEKLVCEGTEHSISQQQAFNYHMVITTVIKLSSGPC